MQYFLVFSLSPGAWYECFDPAGGEAVKLYINEDDFGLTVTVGDEKPVYISYRESIEGYDGYPDDDPEAHIFITYRSTSEIEFESAGGKYWKYNGIYIQLPDQDEE